MMINHFLLCILIYYNSKNLQILATNIFVFTFYGSMGQAMWVYTSEILPSNGMTIVAFMNMLMTVFLGAFTSSLIKILTNIGFFFIFGVIQIASTVFVYIFVSDRTGNSNNNLYSWVAVICWAFSESIKGIKPAFRHRQLLCFIEFIQSYCPYKSIWILNWKIEQVFVFCLYFLL